MVNYHAIAQYIQNQGGQVLQTTHHHSHLNVCAFVLGNCPNGFIEVYQAYTEAIEKFGLDDLFCLKKGIEKNYDALTLEQLLAYLRLSGWDVHIFLACFSSLMANPPFASETTQQELYWAIQQVWDTYYPIGESCDLALHLGQVLSQMHYYSEALEYFQQSLKLNSTDPNIPYNIGKCHYHLRQLDTALDHLERALELNPEFEPAKVMRIKIQAEVSRRALIDRH